MISSYLGYLIKYTHLLSWKETLKVVNLASNYKFVLRSISTSLRNYLVFVDIVEVHQTMCQFLRNILILGHLQKLTT